MDINEMTIGQAKEIAQMVSNNHVTECGHPYQLGETYFIRTVTHHLIGKLKYVGQQELVLEGGTVMWVADSGRFSDFLENGPQSDTETEVYGKNDVIVGRGSLIDATPMGVSMAVVQR